MRFFKKTVSAALAVVMALCSNIICSAEENDNLNEQQLSVTPSEITEELQLTDEYYTYFEKSRATSNVGTTFYKTNTLESNDAIDFYPFSLTSGRTSVFGFKSSNSNYIANLGVLYDDGTVELSNITVNPGVVSWISNLPQGTYCWVVMSSNNTYTTDKYTLGMNASNMSGATQVEYISSDYSHAVCRYDIQGRDMVYSNGENITLAAAEFINTMEGTMFKDRYESGGDSAQVATVGVVSTYLDIDGDTLYYGSYTSTSPYRNLENGLYHSSDEVIFIPIKGYTFQCTISGKYIPFQTIRDVATGFLVYDLNTKKVIDWMSSSNIFYVQGGFFNFKFSYGIYADLPFENNTAA